MGQDSTLRGKLKHISRYVTAPFRCAVRSNFCCTASVGFVFLFELSSVRTSRNAFIVETAVYLSEKENLSKSAGWGAKTHKMPFFRRCGQWPPIHFGIPYMREADSLPYEDADALYKRRGGYYPPVKRGTGTPGVPSDCRE